MLAGYWLFPGSCPDGGKIRYCCEVPDGTKARLTLPDGRNEILTGGTYQFEEIQLGIAGK